MDLPEGFNPRDDGTFHGIPAWCMSEANMIAASFINKRPWDVPCLADAIFQSYKKGLIDGAKSMTYRSRTLVHIEVGDDSWTPTDRNLQDITRDFKKALDVDADGIGLVATRTGVKVTITQVEGDVVLDVNAKDSK
jgi:hypothetical protein